MIQSLPKGGFKWFETKEVGNFDLNSVNTSDSIGYLLEMNSDYPLHLHELHDDCSLARERITITKSMLSTYCQDLK